MLKLARQAGLEALLPSFQGISVLQRSFLVPSFGYGTGSVGYGGAVSGAGNTTLTTTMLRRLQVKPHADASRSGSAI